MGKLKFVVFIFYSIVIFNSVRTQETPESEGKVLNHKSMISFDVGAN